MVTYNKEGIAKKGDRLLYSGGPRDRQRKLAEQDSLALMKKELGDITTVMSTKDVGYSKEQVENIINKSLTEVSVDLEKKYLEKINLLEKEIILKDTTISNLTDTVTKLNTKLDAKDSMLLELTNKISEISSRPSNITYTSSRDESVTEDPSRPAIDKIFIDPTTKGDEDKYESHVTSIETKSDKPVVSDTVSKLRQIMGNKIPK